MNIIIPWTAAISGSLVELGELNLVFGVPAVSEQRQSHCAHTRKNNGNRLAERETQKLQSTDHCWPLAGC